MAMLRFSLAILITWVAVVAKAEGPSLAQPPDVAAVDCQSLIYNMADCVSFFSVGSNETKPSYMCCLGFKEVLYTDAGCICEELRSNVDLGIEIDISKAATLPSACGVSGAPSISNCDAYPPSGDPSSENTTPLPLPSFVNEAPAPANSEWILNPAPAPSPLISGDSPTIYPLAEYFRLLMIVSIML